MSDKTVTFLEIIRDHFNISDNCMPILVAVAWVEPIRDDPNRVVMHADSTPKVTHLQNDPSIPEIVKNELKKLHWIGFDTLEEHIALVRQEGK